MTTRVSMSSSGRITLPASIRRRLHLHGETEFEVEELEGGTGIVLRPAVVVLREDAWAYEPGVLASIRRGLQDLQEGRERTATEADFRALAEVAED